MFRCISRVAEQDACRVIPPVCAALPFVLALSTLAAIAQSTAPSRAPSSGPRVHQLAVSFGTPSAVTRDGLVEESFELSDELVTALRGLEVGSTLELSEFPVAPGERFALSLVAVDVYAPGAILYLVDDGEQRSIERSPDRYFRGTTPGGGFSVALSLDPHGRLGGTVMQETSVAGSSEMLELVPRSDADPFMHSIRRTTDSLDLAMSCAADALDSRDIDSLVSAPDAARRSEASVRVAGSRSAVIAVDTDTELMSKRFSGSQAAAVTWIASLFNTMNLIYDRDLDLHLVQGTTFLRVNSDPWQVQGSPATGSHLQEFGQYWFGHYGNVERVFAMLLSGKSSSGFGASGIAWLDGFCEKQSSGGGYSINQVFWSPSVSVAHSVSIVAHEIGHNLGSHHTHCYDPPVDRCYASEGACYSGATSCPAGGGTLMSYCHLTGCGSSHRLHNRVQDRMDQLVVAHQPSCIGSTIEVFADSFESGTGAWSQTTP